MTERSDSGGKADSKPMTERPHAMALELATRLMKEHGLAGWRVKLDHARRRAGQCDFTAQTISSRGIMSVMLKPTISAIPSCMRLPMHWLDQSMVMMLFGVRKRVKSAVPPTAATRCTFLRQNGSCDAQTAVLRLSAIAAKWGLSVPAAKRL